MSGANLQACFAGTEFSMKLGLGLNVWVLQITAEVNGGSTVSSHKINHLSELSSNRFQEQFATSPTPAGTSADLLPIAPDKIFTWCNVKQKH